MNEKINTNEDKYLDMYGQQNRDSFKIQDDRDARNNEGQNYNTMGSYDSYNKQNSLTQKIGNIMQGVDKMQSKIDKQDRSVYK